MGLDTNGIKFLLYAKKNNVQFGRALTLGRQSYQLDKTVLEKILLKNGYSSDDFESLIQEYVYVEPLLHKLGATEVHSMDASTYESASIIHDLNTPVPTSLKQQYDTVIDAGTLEHIFNFPVAIKSCMEMVALNGHFMGITCGNNFSGHGFYQFSPELFFRIFSAENGFEIKKIFLVVNEPGDYWYEIPDPKSVKKRIIFENSKQSYLFILARRTAIKEIFTHTPQQSDYEHLAWEGKEQFARTKKSLSQRIFFFLPDHVKKGIRRKLRILDPKAWKVFLRDTGNGNKEEFKRTQNY